MNIRVADGLEKGFSLVELLVVVAIVGILSAVAVPQYQEYVMRGRLTEAQTGLANGRVRAEQYFQDNRKYDEMPCPGDTANFIYRCVAAGNAYTITATGIAAGTDGFTMTIDQDNVQATPHAPSGWATSTNCWVTRKGGC